MSLPATYVYLVKCQHSNECGNWTDDEVIAVCSSMDKALEHVDKPNYDIIITRVTVDSDMTDETLIQNVEKYRIRKDGE